MNEHFKNMPRRAMIGHKKFKIEFEKRIDFDGYIDYEAQRIVLVDDMTPSVSAYILLHEITHGIFKDRELEYFSNCVCDGNKEEIMVTLLSRGFIKFFQENKKLIVWILENLD